MNKFPINIIKISISSFFIILIASCSINWQDRAVCKAREKALSELTLLDDADRFEVKFGQPVIYRKKLLNRSGNTTISKNDVCHIWVVWELPKTKGKYLIVSGVSEARMDDWYPENVFLRNIDDFVFDKESLEAAK